MKFIKTLLFVLLMNIAVGQPAGLPTGSKGNLGNNTEVLGEKVTPADPQTERMQKEGKRSYTVYYIAGAIIVILLGIYIGRRNRYSQKP